MRALEGITPLVPHQIGTNIHLAMSARCRWLACRIKLTRCRKLITGTNLSIIFPTMYRLKVLISKTSCTPYIFVIILVEIKKKTNCISNVFLTRLLTSIQESSVRWIN